MADCQRTLKVLKCVALGNLLEHELPEHFEKWINPPQVRKARSFEPKTPTSSPFPLQQQINEQVTSAQRQRQKEAFERQQAAEQQQAELQRLQQQSFQWKMATLLSVSLIVVGMGVFYARSRRAQGSKESSKSV